MTYNPLTFMLIFSLKKKNYSFYVCFIEVEPLTTRLCNRARKLFYVVQEFLHNRRTT